MCMLISCFFGDIQFFSSTLLHYFQGKKVPLNSKNLPHYKGNSFPMTCQWFVMCEQRITFLLVDLKFIFLEKCYHILVLSPLVLTWKLQQPNYFLHGVGAPFSFHWLSGLDDFFQRISGHHYLFQFYTCPPPPPWISNGQCLRKTPTTCRCRWTEYVAAMWNQNTHEHW